MDQLEKAALVSSRGWRLQISIGAIFAFLTLPSIAGLIFWSYSTSRTLINDYTERAIERAAQDAIANMMSLLRPISDSVLLAGTVESASPGFFRNSESNLTKIQVLSQNPDVLSFYTGFDDGSFYQLQRTSPGAKLAGTTTPAESRYALRVIDRKTSSTPHEDYIFLDENGKQTGEFRGERSTYDPRTRSFWQNAHSLSPIPALPITAISDPFVIGSVQKLGVSISSPVFRNGKLAVSIATNLTLARISDYLREHSVSARSTTFIVSKDGTVIAHPDATQMARLDGKEAVPMRTSELSSPVLRAAFARRAEHQLDSFTFTASSDGKEYVAKFLPFPSVIEKPWEVIVVAPTDDFIGELRERSQNMVIFGIGLTVFLLALIISFARLISKPLEGLIQEIQAIETFSLDDRARPSSRIREVKQLIAAIETMKIALRAFTAYVPSEIVRALLVSRQPIKAGGHSSYLTVLFTDLASFSSLAETTPARALLDQVSTYLGIVTHAVHEAQGSVDKFIGDAVMAFWGAPLPDNDHAFHACVAAVASKRRLAAQNDSWQEAGQHRLTMRVGIHSDAVLVGNIGSAERLSYTVMGDGVNIAARLEGTNKEFGTSICISHAVFRECGERLWLRPIEEVAVKGRKGSLLVYELLGIRDVEGELAATPREQDLCRRTTAAYQAMMAGDLAAAAEEYQVIADSFDDSLAREMVKRCSLSDAAQLQKS